MGFVNTDTIAIIVAIVGVGLALWRAMDSRYKELREDIKAMDARFTSRIDNLYQALFSRKDPAA